MKRKGSLFQRDGIFWLRYEIEGVPFSMSLKTRIKQVAQGSREKIMLDRQKGLDQYEDFLHAEIRRIKKFRGEVTFENLNLNDVWEAFLESPKRTTQSIDLYLTAWTNFVMPQRHDARIMDVTPLDASKYICTLEDKGITNGTAKKHIMALRTIFDTLLPSGRENPFADAVARGSREVFSYEPVTLEQCRELLKEASEHDPEMCGLLMVLVYTGLRLSDAAKLRKDDIDLDRGTITVMPSKTARYNKKAIIGIHPAIKDVLSVYTREHIFPVLCRYSRDQLSDSVRSVFACAGVVKLKKRSSGRSQNVYGASSFRHLMEDRLRQSGASQVVINTILCHSDKSMAGVYSTVTDQELIAAVEKAYPDLRGETK